MREETRLRFPSVRLPRPLLAAVLALALAYAAAPVVAYAQGAAQVAVVQGTLPIGDDASYDTSLMSSGYTSRENARALSAAAVEDVAGGDAPMCGTPFANPLPEGLSLDSANALAQDGRARNRSGTQHQVGDTRTIFAFDRPEEGFKARAIAAGDTYTIWEEEGYDLFTPADLAMFADQLDAATAAVYNTFGNAAIIDLDGDGKVAFVFHRFGENMESASGYFWSGDLFSKEDLKNAGATDAEAGSTNEMDMLHLDTTNTAEGSFSKDLVMVNLVHELQHLVNYAQTDGNGESWLDETFSQAATAVAGYGESEAPRMEGLWFFAYKGVGLPFVFEGNYVPGDAKGVEGAVVYAQWYLFSRYLSNQTRGLASEDGALIGGDELYRSVLDCERNGEGFGFCTKESLVKTLEALGYLGKGEGCVASDFNELVLNYNTALLVRDATGPYSLTNDARVDPSVIDGARVDLFEVEDRLVPEEVYGGAAAVYVGLDRAQPAAAGVGEGVQERVVDSPLPLGSVVRTSPVSGSALCDGDPVELLSPQLDALDGARFEYCAMTRQEFDDTAYEWTYRAYDGPVAFDARAPILAARLVCDRGAYYPKFFFYEVDASQPEDTEKPDPGKPEKPSPGPVPDPGEGKGVPGELDEADAPTLAGSDAAALALTGDPLALAVGPLVALAVAGAAAALAAMRRDKG